MTCPLKVRSILPGERYQLSKDSMTWELKPGAAPDNAHYQEEGNTNVNGEDMTEIEENMLLPISGQELPIRWFCSTRQRKPVTHVSRDGPAHYTLLGLEELPAVTARLFPHKTSLLGRPAGNSRTPQTGS